MREIIEEGINRILGDRVTPQLLRRSWEGNWDGSLWLLLAENGFTRAVNSAAADGPGATWAEIYPLLVACGYYQLPLPLPESILANRLLEEAGMETVSGVVGLLDLKDDETRSSGESDAAGYVPWGRACSHVVTSFGRSPNTLCLYKMADLSVEQGTNLAREPRDKIRLSAAKPVLTAELARATDRIRVGGAMLRTAQAAGAAQSALEQTLVYARDRVQFGRPLAKFQAVQQQIASAVSEVAALNAASEYACNAEPSEAQWAVAVAKITASEAGDVVCDVAHTVHGAIGYTLEHRLHHATQRLRSWSGEFGNLRWWSERLGKAVCAMGADAVIPVLVDGNLELLR